MRPGDLVSTLSRSERLRLVECDGCAPSGHPSLSVQAELLRLSRSSLYYQPVAPSAEKVALKHRIDEIYTAYPFYGSRRITAQLQREGVTINRKAVQRHMREMSIAGIWPGPNLSKRNQGHGVYHPYLLRQVVVSWQLDDTLDIDFVLAAVDRALTNHKPVIWNSDQAGTLWVHFTSPQYTQRLLVADVHISLDGKGRALDNIFTERLWRTVKYQEVYLHDYQTPKQARTDLTAYFDFYNYRRLLQALDDLTPAEVFFADTIAIPNLQ